MAKSLTGLFSSQHEVARLHALYYTRKNQLSDDKNFGLDWDFWTLQVMEDYPESFATYLVNEAALFGIMIMSARVERAPAKLLIHVEVAPEHSLKETIIPVTLTKFLK